MSGQWSGWAALLPGTIRGNVRVAAFVLGDASDPDGLVTYGIKKLAQRGAMSERSWQRACDELEAHGWVTKHANAVESIKTRTGKTIHLKGNKRPNLYVLNAEPVPEAERRLTVDDIESRRNSWGVTDDTSTRGVTDDTSWGVTDDTSPPVRGVTDDTQSHHYPTGSHYSSASGPTPPPTPTPSPAAIAAMNENYIKGRGLTATVPAQGKARCRVAGNPIHDLAALAASVLRPEVVFDELTDAEWRGQWFGPVNKLVALRGEQPVRDTILWLRDDTRGWWLPRVPSIRKLGDAWDRIQEDILVARRTAATVTPITGVDPATAGIVKALRGMYEHAARYTGNPDSLRAAVAEKVADQPEWVRVHALEAYRFIRDDRNPDWLDRNLAKMITGWAQTAQVAS